MTDYIKEIELDELCDDEYFYNKFLNEHEDLSEIATNTARD